MFFRVQPRFSKVKGSTPEDREGLSLFIALRWMQEPCGVMVWVAENIQACLRIFRRAQHQWLARDILHLPQGVFTVFVLHPPQEYTDENLSSGVLPSRQRLHYELYPRALPPVTHSSAFQAPERWWRPIRGRTIPRTGVYLCLSPCDGCKTVKG